MYRVESAERMRPHFLERVSGDAVVLRQEDGRFFAAIVDVLGHGEEAHRLALEVGAFLGRRWNTDDPVGLLKRLHEHMRGSRGVAAGVCFLDRGSGLLRYAGVGNTVIRRFGASETRLLSRPGIIGANIRTPREERMTLVSGDVVLMYTDGVKDRFQLDDYPQLLHHGAEAIAATIIRRFGKEHDDATCIAMRCEQ